ncbi:cilia- and flagella-associated protein 300 [Lampetra fluviatilis]
MTMMTTTTTTGYKEEVYSPVERDEFLFRVLRHVALGGQLSQHDGEMAPYLVLTRHLYRLMLSVHKDPRSGQLRITSHVYKTSAFDAQGRCVYPGATRHPQTFSYLVVDPDRRVVRLLHHSYGVNLH